MTTPASTPHHMAELAQRRLLAAWPITVGEYPTITMTIDPQVEAELVRRLAVPLEQIEQQTIYITTDVGRQQQAVFNLLRGRRGVTTGPYVPPPVPRDFDVGGHWNAAYPNPQIQEPFGVIRGDRERVLVRANIARSGVASAIVFLSDRPDHLSLSLHDYAALAETAWTYMRAAHRYDRSLKYWVLFHNGGRRSAGSLDWNHLQIVGLPVPFGLLARIACVGDRDYFTPFLRAHELAGLAVPVAGDFVAVSDLVPAKEFGVVAASDTLVSGAKFMRQMVNHLIAHHQLQSYSLAAFLNPALFGASPLLDLPPVLWSFVDRGPAGSPVGDFGCLEALAGTAVVATDPYAVAQALRAAFHGP